MLFRRHCCLLLSTNFCNALSLHRHDKLLTLAAGCFQWLAPCFCSSWSGDLPCYKSLDSARSYVMQGTFLTRGKASSIPTIFSWGGSISPDSFLPSILLLLVIIVAVILVVVSEVLGTVAMGKYGFSSFKPADEANSAFRTFKIERLATYKLFVATFSFYSSFSLSGVPIGIASI
ncbi:hypothetical protein Tco_1204957 [Tanacetum coccineum]